MKVKICVVFVAAIMVATIIPVSNASTEEPIDSGGDVGQGLRR